MSRTAIVIGAGLVALLLVIFMTTMGPLGAIQFQGGHDTVPTRSQINNNNELSPATRQTLHLQAEVVKQLGQTLEFLTKLASWTQPPQPPPGPPLTQIPIQVNVVAAPPQGGASEVASPPPPPAAPVVGLAGKYTGPHGLTYEDIVFWHRQGYLLRRGVFNKEEIANLTAVLNEIAATPDKPTSQGGAWKYYEKNVKDTSKKVINRIERIADFPAIATLAKDIRIFGTVSALLGEEGILFKDKTNYKLPGGGKFEPHQDIQPRWDMYAATFITVLITVDYNLKENGCLEVAPGHHARGLIGRYNSALNESETKNVHFVPVETAPGDLLFFDGWTPHKSSDNLSDMPRRNTYLTYTKRSEGDMRARYYMDKHKSLPPDADRDPTKDYSYKV
jgi:hypothetical protein